MKINLTILLATTLVSSICHADCKQSAEIANKFIDSYTQYNNDIFNQKTQQTVLEWLQKNKTVTHHFTNSYQQLVKQAEKEDPELGLDFDPIFNAQDYPEQGFKIVNCNEQSNFVTLAGKDKEWENFKVVVKVLNTKTGWLIDGVGVINIPKDKQASR